VSGAGRRAVVTGLAVAGAGLLATSTVIELSNVMPRAELSTGVGAGAAFLSAMALSRGADQQVLAQRARFLVGAGLAALLSVAALWQATERSAPRVFLLLIPVCLLFSTAALALREAAAQRQAARVREVRARFEGEESERRRWVRELHDDTLQELAAVTVLLGAAASTADPAERTERLTQARDLVGRQIHALRRLISQVRPLALDTLGLNAALEDLGRRARETPGAPEIEVLTDELPRLPSDTETSVYRIVQEAINNAIRHGQAKRITIEGRAQSGTFELVIRDDGTGYPSAGLTQGHGVRGMRERAVALGGRLHIAPGETGGTEVTLRMPYPA
jgi:signal transduction histidine kinase